MDKRSVYDLIDRWLDEASEMAAEADDLLSKDEGSLRKIQVLMARHAAYTELAGQLRKLADNA
jgi:hypothetical protein